MAKSQTFWLYTPSGLRNMDPTPLRSRLAPLRFDGEAGIIKSSRDNVLKEVRFEYLLTKTRKVTFKGYEGDYVEKDVSYETVHTVTLRFNSKLDLLIAEAKSSAIAGEVIEAISAALDCTFELQSFDKRAMKKLIKLAEDVRKLKLFGLDDPFVGELQLKGSALASSAPFKNYAKKGKIREIAALVSMPSGSSYVIDMNVGGKLKISGKGESLNGEDVFQILSSLAD